MAKKVTARERTKLRLKNKIRGSEGCPRLSVFKSTKHVYAQIVRDDVASTLVSASTVEKELAGKIVKLEDRTSTSTKSISAAKAVGALIAERAKAKGIEKVVFDRNGFLYHGRIKAIADGAREAGLKF